MLKIRIDKMSSDAVAGVCMFAIAGGFFGGLLGEGIGLVFMSFWQAFGCAILCMLGGFIGAALIGIHLASQDMRDSEGNPYCPDAELRAEMEFCCRWIGDYVCTAKDGGDAWCSVRDEPGASEWATRLQRVYNRLTENES